jgi:hypothetical protein
MVLRDEGYFVFLRKEVTNNRLIKRKSDFFYTKFKHTVIHEFSAIIYINTLIEKAYTLIGTLIFILSIVFIFTMILNTIQ